MKSSSWKTFLYPLAGLPFIMFMIFYRPFEKPYIFYYAVIYCIIIIFMLCCQYKIKIFIVSILYLALPLSFYYYLFPHLKICYNSREFLFWSFNLAILLGFLSSLISFMGSVQDRFETQEANTGQILISASFLSFVVALVILYVTTTMKIGADEQIIVEEFGTQQVGTLIMQILPIGSWVVPIQSFFYGKSYLTNRAGRKRFSYFFSGLVLSFLLGFVFGILAFAVAAASEYAHPVHYPFMLTSWLVIAFYLFLLESNIWNFGYHFDFMRRLLLQPEKYDEMSNSRLCPFCGSNRFYLQDGSNTRECWD